MEKEEQLAESPLADEADEHFFPKGAIAFLVTILLLFIVIWLSVYGIMLERANTSFNPPAPEEETSSR